MISYIIDPFFTLREFSMVENQEKSNVVTPWAELFKDGGSIRTMVPRNPNTVSMCILYEQIVPSCTQTG